jgi:hypothetical protein
MPACLQIPYNVLDTEHVLLSTWTGLRLERRVEEAKRFAYMPGHCMPFCGVLVAGSEAGSRDDMMLGKKQVCSCTRYTHVRTRGSYPPYARRQATRVCLNIGKEKIRFRRR